MPSGTLIVADKYTHSVKIIAVDGALLQVIGTGQPADGPGKFTTEGVKLKGDIYGLPIWATIVSLNTL